MGGTPWTWIGPIGTIVSMVVGVWQLYVGYKRQQQVSEDEKRKLESTVQVEIARLKTLLTDVEQRVLRLETLRMESRS